MKIRTQNSKFGAQAGLTLLETSIGMLVLVLMLGSILESMSSMKNMTSLGSAETDIQHSVERAMNRITMDLRTSGFVTLDDGRSFPVFVEDGVAPDGYSEEHSHPDVVKNVPDEDPASGVDRGLIFVRYADADNNDVPDINWAADPKPVVRWEEAETISYSVRTEADGRNALFRTVAGQDSRVVARNVERVVFDTAATAGPLEVPLGVVRVRLWFYDVNGKGFETRAQAEASVRLRNGDSF